MFLGSSNMATTTVGENSIKDHGILLPPPQFSFPTSIHELLWEEKTRTLRELISSYRLPLAVKLKVGDISKYCADVGTKDSVSPDSSFSSKSTLDSDSTLSLSSSSHEGKDTASGKSDRDVILQIHETRKKKIILSRRMTWEKRQNDYVVTGEHVEIPASFKGWLEVVPEDRRPVEYFDTIGGITSVKPKKFLVRTATVGYQLATEQNGNSCWVPSEIKPGEVLTTGIVYMDGKKNKNSPQKNIFKRLLKQSKPKRDQELKYLQCFDSSGGEIMIPLIMSGVFSPVGDSSVANYDAVYELQDLIMAFGLPVNVQLIHANTRESFQCPRGVLRLYGAREEEVAVVSKVGLEGGLFRQDCKSGQFEIPVDKEMFFSRGVVKKKPTIKSKLVDVFTAASGEREGRTKPTQEENEIQDKDYVRAKPVDEFKVRSTGDRCSSTSVSNKFKPIPANEPVYSKVKPMATVDRAADGEHRDANWSKMRMESATLPREAHRPPTSLSAPSVQTDVNPPHPDLQPPKLNNDVELPERIPKEMKKSKSTGILDKLSVRKVRKDRAKLKELKGDDVFSKRLARNELSYQDFFNGLGDDDANTPKNSEGVNAKQDDSEKGSNGGTYQSSSSAHDTSKPNTPPKTAAVPSRDTTETAPLRSSIQNRELPPIPLDSPRHSDTESPGSNTNLSRESLYEHLPPAPQPPANRRAGESVLLVGRYNDEVIVVDDAENEEDGYMVPRQVQQEQRYIKRSDLQLRRKQPSFSNGSLQNTKLRNARSELSHDFLYQTRGYDGDCPFDIDDLFRFPYSSREFGENRPLGTSGSHHAVSTSRLYDTTKVPAWRSDIHGEMSRCDQRFVDNLDLETRSYQKNSVRNPSQSKQMNANPNATIRSHNIRTMRPNAMEMFHLTDSIRDVIVEPQSSFQNSFNGPLQNVYDKHSNARPQLHVSRSLDASTMSLPYQQHLLQQQQQQQAIYGTGGYYAESEPGFRPNRRPPTSLNEAYFKHGDDSAISLCSKGDAGFPNESEYSYNEWEHARLDDGWTPPNQIENMSVQEVAKSLRYIGMKDRVVLRFSNEQIDGSMLCTLDKRLLKEGFPELNALEVKKIVDFVQGWRPKKR